MTDTPTKYLLGVAAILFCVIYGVYTHSRVIHSTDATWALPTAVSVVRDGDFFLGEFKDLIRAKKRYGIQRRKKRPINLFPYGTSLLIAPVVALIEFQPKLLPYLLWNTKEALKAEKPPDIMDVRLRAERALGSLITTCSLLFLFLIATKYLSLSWSVLLTLAFAFGTPAWSTASRGLWQHGPVMLLFSVSLYFFVNRKELTSLAGVPLSFGYLVRPTTAPIWLLGAIYIFFEKRRALLLYLFFSLLVILLFFLLNQEIYGKWTNAKYYKPGRLAYHPDFFQAFAANLFSPNRGLFFQSPFLLLSFFSLPLFKDEKLRPLLFLCWCAFGGHLLMTSLFPNWWHGHSFGSRYMADVLPFLFILICLALNHYRQLWIKLSFGLLVCISIPIHYAGANSPAAFGWNVHPVNIDEHPERVWSLTDWQPRR